MYIDIILYAAKVVPELEYLLFQDINLKLKLIF